MNSGLQTLDEESLLAQCKKELPHVMEAYAEVVRRHERQVFNLCRRYLGTAEEAEDATQDIFMRVYHGLPKFEGRSQFKTWLYRIATNHCHDVIAKRKKFVHDWPNEEEEDGGNLFDSLLIDEQSPEHEYNTQEEEDCVQTALNAMRNKDSEVLSLRFMGELSLEEIAATLGTKLSATKMRFYRAMEQFKHLYEKLCM